MFGVCVLCLSAGRMYPRQASVPQTQGGGGAPPGGVGLAGRTTFLRRSTNAKTSKPSDANLSGQPPPSYQQAQSSCNFANYQNCTIVRSHVPHGNPHGNYGYVKAAPKILIFPIFVQVCVGIAIFPLSSFHHSVSDVRVFCPFYLDNIWTIWLVMLKTQYGRNTHQCPYSP